MNGRKLDVNYACDVTLHLHYSNQYMQAVKWKNNWTPLKQAIELKDKTLVGDLIQAGADVNAYHLIQQNTIDYTPLMDAVLKGDMEICTILLQNGADVNATSSSKAISKTVLVIAAQLNRPDAIVELLLDHGAIHTMDKFGHSLPMYSALSFNKANLVDLFMRNGYKWQKYPCPKSKSVIRDELCDAIEAEAEECCIRLLQWGFDIFSSDYPYFFCAIKHGMTRLTIMLTQVNPLFLQLRWTVLNDISSSWDTCARDILGRLQEERKDPKTLQELCKALVLRELTSTIQPVPILEQINNLPIPTQIKQFLNFCV